MINEKLNKDILDLINENKNEITKFKGKELWVNPSQTNNFNAQTITLNESINNYEYYEIIFRQNTNSSRYFSTGKIPVGYGTILNAYSSNFRATETTVSGNTIVFESATPDNSYVIPVKIIGYK